MPACAILERDLPRRRLPNTGRDNPGMWGAPHALADDLVQTRARERAVLLLQSALVTREPHLMARPTLDNQAIEPGPRLLGDITGVETPRVIAAQARLALNQRQPGAGPLLEQRQCDQRILQSTTDQQVVVRRGC